MSVRRGRTFVRFFRDFRNGLRITLTPAVLTVFLGIVVAAIAGQLAVMHYLSNDYGLEAEQAIQWRLARQFAPEFTRAGVPIPRSDFSKKLGELSQRYPDAELYVLDDTGYVIASDPAKPPPVLPLIIRAPLEEALRWGAFRRAITADDPMRLKRGVYFSVAKLPQKGYLYVVLRGNALGSLANVVQGGVLGTASTFVLLMGTIIPLAAGSLIFTRLFRRIRSMEESASNLAHDLKAPLASTRALLETMLMHQKTLTNEKRAEYIETALKSIGSLSTLANNLMEIWRYESSESLRAAAPVVLDDLISDVVAKFRPQAELREIRLTIKTDGRPARVNGNVGALERVLSNLLDNAIQHSPQKREVTVSLTRHWFSRVHCTVENEGGMLSKRDASRLFERFYSSRAAIDGHCGLGLVICRKIIEAHNGVIWARSTPGKEVRFTFSLREYSRRQLVESARNATGRTAEFLR